MVESIIKMLKGGSIDSDLQEAIARKVGEVEFFSGSRDRGVEICQAIFWATSARVL